ncbi:hypothetical protein L1049_012890 [Liquidambar formosana]|uniref:Transposase MuDR plant domain-containing protein n=1 Tax=Liquidambar formosana TaxID=63359 RepID=A0AAP0RLB2_LIQFO
MSEYADYNDFISLDSSSDDEGRLKPMKYPEFCRERDMLSPKLVLGTTFATVQDFRDLMREVAIRKGYDLFFIKNDGDRITVRCRDNCGWRVHASYVKGKEKFQVKTLRHPKHSCSRLRKND